MKILFLLIEETEVRDRKKTVNNLCSSKKSKYFYFEFRYKSNLKTIFLKIGDALQMALHVLQHCDFALDLG